MDYNDKIKNAAKKQKSLSFFDAHLLQPLLKTASQPYRTASNKSTSLSLRLPIEIKNELEKIADRHGITVNQMVKNAVLYAIELHHEREEAAELYRKQFTSLPPIGKEEIV